MATWGLHMRIAEKILEMGYDLDVAYFVVGNIGADCGVPNEDWSQFTPHTNISHWSNGGKSGIQEDKFREAYLMDELIEAKKRSFLVGYYVHLLTDKIFTRMINEKKSNDIHYAPWKLDHSFIWTIKKDWYDLDHKYFRDNPANIFHGTFQHIKDFPDYMDYYPVGAVQRQVNYITAFYLNPPEDLDRAYIYLNEEEMASFLDVAVEEIVTDIESWRLVTKASKSIL